MVHYFFVFFLHCSVLCYLALSRFNRNVMAVTWEKKWNSSAPLLALFSVWMRTFSTSFCPFHFSFALSCFTVPLSFFPISNVATLHGRFNKEINSTQKPNNWIIWCGSNLRINFYVRCDVFISKKTTHFSSFAHQTMPVDRHTRRTSSTGMHIAQAHSTSFWCFDSKKCLAVSTNYVQSTNV